MYYIRKGMCIHIYAGPESVYIRTGMCTYIYAGPESVYIRRASQIRESVHKLCLCC